MRFSTDFDKKGTRGFLFYIGEEMKPLILITNDDGIYSPGIRAVSEAVSDLGEILVAAPITQQTSMGRAFPRTIDQGISCIV